MFPSLAVVAHNLADLLLTLSPSGPLTFSPSGPLLVLLMAFSIGLMYYNVQPPREMSAYRRSHARGFLVYFATCALTCGILLVSVGVKHCMHSTIAAGGELSAGHAWLLHGSLALVLHLIFWLRFGHYFGVEPRRRDAVAVKGVKCLWWAVVGVWPAVPLIAAGVSVSRGGISALGNLGLAAGVCGGVSRARNCRHVLACYKRCRLYLRVVLAGIDVHPSAPEWG